MPFCIVVFWQDTPGPIVEGNTLAPVVGVVVVLEEEAIDTPDTVVEGQVSTAKELLFNGSRSD